MKSIAPYVRMSILLMIIPVLVSTSVAQWSFNPVVNNAICTATSYQTNAMIASDGSGGAIITWQDGRSGVGNGYDIYAQRIDASGAVQWTANGVAICTATGDQQLPTIVRDSSGGAIITWQDHRIGNYDVYAQRINALGIVQWTSDGVGICTATGDQSNPTIASDGSGGAIITWVDHRIGNYDIYAQRINTLGIVQWTSDGVGICTATSDQSNPTIASDGSGGAIITWHEYRIGSYDIYAQRIDASGAVQWTANGVAICTATGDQQLPTIVRDSSGGAIITWQDHRIGNYDVYAQRINALGIVQWTSNGVGICTATGDQSNPTIASDGSGGAIITWVDHRIGNYDIYAQRINTLGIVQWTSDGVGICTATGDQYNPMIASDGSGGAIMTWPDHRSGSSYDIYVQRINASGTVQWTSDGVGICTATNDQQLPAMLCDSSGGAIITWQDYRIGSYDIYAQRVDRRGSLYPQTWIHKVGDIANDQGGKVRIEWGFAGSQLFTSYGVWRRIPRRGVGESVSHGFLPKIANDTLGTLYDLIATVPATQSPSYNVVASTWEDSSSTGAHWCRFLVTAHTDDPAVFYLSDEDSGYSVDNIVPKGPDGASATPLATGSIRISWNPNSTDPDVGYYEVFRSTTEGFVPTPGNLLTNSTSLSYEDNSVSAGQTYYYRIKTADIHDNESPLSPEFSATAFFVSPALFSQQGGKLIGTGNVGTSTQGNSVALSDDGNTAIVGGMLDNNQIGAAWVFVRSAGVWSQQGDKLVGTNAGAFASQGNSVALSADGNTAIVGGSGDNVGVGAVWVFVRSGGIWTQQGEKLVGSDNIGMAGQGTSVSLSADGNTAIVGGMVDDSYHGAAWIFVRSEGVWNQQGGKLVGTGAIGAASQGMSVSISSDGNTAIVGGNGDNSGIGAAWVFTRTGNTWSQEGNKLVGTGVSGASDQGKSVALSSDGNTALVGGIGDGDHGATWVFVRSAGVWTQQGNKLVGTGAVGLYIEQGCSVSLSHDGNTAIIGGNGDSSGVGAVWIVTRTAGAWAQEGCKLVGTGGSNPSFQGRSVGLSGDGTTAIVGGIGDNGYIGAVWVFYKALEPVIASISDVPSDQGGNVRVNWKKSFYDSPSSIHPITTYGLWRRLPGAVPGQIAPSLAKIAGDTLGTSYDLITAVPAVQSPSYNVVAPTFMDSATTGIHRYVYVVTAHTSDPSVYFISKPDSGYSVDNIPPVSPIGCSMTTLPLGPIRLSWQRNQVDLDLGHYAAYRSPTCGFSPCPSLCIATTLDSVFVDSSTCAGQTYFYRITAVDTHGNESVPSEELSAVALNVQLHSFTATAIRFNADIHWTTATEVNNAGFEIERKGSNDQSWTKHTFVAGKGTSSSPSEYSFVDRPGCAGRFSYRLKQISLGGAYQYSQNIEVEVGLAPREFTLSQNYPNPFNPVTKIEFTLAGDGYVSLQILDMLGREVATLVNRELKAGEIQQATFDASKVASGVYFCRLQANGKVLSRKMLLLK